MKRINLLLFLSAVCLCIQAEQQYKILFKQSDFFCEKKGEYLKISTMAPGAYFSSEADAPALPCFTYSILRPNGNTLKEYHIEVEKNLIGEQVALESNPTVCSTNVVLTDTMSHIASKSVSSPILYADILSQDGYNMMLFKITPFEYDLATGRLFFISEIRIVFSEQVQTKPLAYDHKVKWKIRDMVINPEEMDSFYPVVDMDHQGLHNGRPSSSHTIDNGTIDYLILTSEALKPAFQDLVSWKIKKGLRVKIFTVEELYAECQNLGLTNLTNQEMIKERLYSKYINYGVKYVLLGGDATVVPVQYCQGKYNITGNTHTESVPTDLYYTNYSSTSPTWDYNGNGIIGEMSDQVSLIPYFYLTRIPVRTTADVTRFTQKLIRYEKGNDSSGMSYVNKMLLAGTNCVGNNTNYLLNNAYFHSEITYNTYIQPNWNGNKDYLYQIDNTTYTNLSTNNTLTNGNLSNLINSGYHFIHMYCHGETGYWYLPNNGMYNYNDASFSTNENGSIIATTACMTNAFDLNNNSLSSSFMNASRGAIAYYGSSRDAIYNFNNTIGPSFLYNTYFFYYLLTGYPTDAPYHYGAVAAHSKQKWVGNAYSNETDGFRYLEFAINPLGDPEMPIYTAVPQNFTDVLITSDENNNVTVFTGGITGCTIALTSTDDGVSYFEVAENVSSYVFPEVTCPYRVTITKHNYRPYESSVLPSNIQIVGDSHIWGSNVYSVNVPGVNTVLWELINESNTSGVSMISNSPYINYCTITCPQSYFKGTLKATIYRGSSFVATRTKSISTAGDFHGTLSEPAHVRDNNIYYPAVNSAFVDGSHIDAYAYDVITITSDDFVNANVSYSSPTANSVWGNNYGDGRISFVYITEPCDITVSGVNTTSQKAFKFYIHLLPTPGSYNPSSSLDVSSSDGSLSISLKQNKSEFVEGNDEWTLKAIDALTGEMKICQSVYEANTILNTLGWKPGLYVIQGIVGDEVLSKKIVVK